MPLISDEEAKETRCVNEGRSFVGPLVSIPRSRVGIPSSSGLGAGIREKLQVKLTRTER
jgi:hypothetical protein